MHKFRLSRLINLELGNVRIALHMMSQIIRERLVLAALLLLAVRMNAVVSMSTGAVQLVMPAEAFLVVVLMVRSYEHDLTN